MTAGFGGFSIRDVSAATITAVVAITFNFSCGALIFAGPLSGHLSYGVTSVLVTSAIAGTVVALTSSFAFAIAGLDTNTTAVLATVSAAIAEALPANPALAARYVSIALVACAIGGGATLYLLGRYRLGYLIRFIPFPIVAGFLASTGWLLANGSLRVAAGVSLPMHAGEFVTQTTGLRLLVAGTVAAALFAARRLRAPLALPAVLVGSSAILDLALRSAYGSVAHARAAGWLLAALGSLHAPLLWSPQTYAGMSWPFLWSFTPGIVTAVGVTILAILFGATALEVHTGVEASLDRELRWSGIASILSGLCGGTLGTLSASRTTTNVTSGAVTRLSGVLVAGACAATLLVGSRVAVLFPRPVLGGLLLFLGLSLLYEWLARSLRSVSGGDVLVIYLIVAVTAIYGFPAALAAGLIAACVIFVIRYGRLNALKYTLTAENKRSRVERSPIERRTLDRFGRQIDVLALQGYMFFGTAYALWDAAQARLPTMSGISHWLLFDFSNVAGLDSSAAYSFRKIARVAGKGNTTVVYSGLSKAAFAALCSAVDLQEHGSARNVFGDLDHALEWCEDQLLRERLPDGKGGELAEWLTAELHDARRFERLLGYLDDVQLAGGDTLFRQGDAADALYLVRSGRLEVVVGESGHERRLRSMAPGSIVGEMGMFTAEPRSASVVAGADARLYRLGAQAFDRMTKDDPDLARAFQAMLFRLQAERLRFANGEIAALDG